MAKKKDNPEPKLLATIECDRQISMARWSPDGRHVVAACYDGSVRRWDLTGEKPTSLSTLTGHNGWATVVAFATAERLIIADSWGRLTCWDYTRDEPAVVWSHEQAHDGWVRDVALTPNGARVATCGMDRRVRLHRVETGELLIDVETDDDAYAVGIDPGGTAIFAADRRGVIREWTLPDGKHRRDYDAAAMYKYHRIQDVGGVRALRFDEQRNRLVCVGGHPTRGATVQAVPTVTLFDPESGEASHESQFGQPKEGFVHDLSVHPSGFYVAVTSGTPGQGQLLLFRPGEEEPFYTSKKFPNCHTTALSPDGTRLLLAFTNKGSNGNGRRLDKEGNYVGNHSPVHVLDLSDVSA